MIGLDEAEMEKSYNMVVKGNSASGWLAGEEVEVPGCYAQAPDPPTLESGIREALSVYLQSTSRTEPLPDFAGAWRVEV